MKHSGRIAIIMVLISLNWIAVGHCWEWMNPWPQGNDLYGIWGVPTGEAVTVGAGGMIMVWDGAAWQLVPSGTLETLRGVWGASLSDIFIVGDRGTILRFNGKSTAKMDCRLSEDLQSVWGTDANNVLAVGTNGAILRFDGTVWNTMTSGTTKPLRGCTQKGECANIVVIRSEG